MCESVLPTPCCLNQSVNVIFRWSGTHHYDYGYVLASSLREWRRRQHHRRARCLAIYRMLIIVFVFSATSNSKLLQMGVGVGGDYPLSAVIASEFASTRIRGRMMTVVFAAQGWGNFGA